MLKIEFLDENIGFCCFDEDCLGYDPQTQQSNPATIQFTWHGWILRICAQDAKLILKLLDQVEVWKKGKVAIFDLMDQIGAWRKGERTGVGPGSGQPAQGGSAGSPATGRFESGLPDLSGRPRPCVCDVGWGESCPSFVRSEADPDSLTCLMCYHQLHCHPQTSVSS